MSGFNVVALDGSGSLIIDVGGAESLTIEAEDNLLPLLTSNVTSSTLKLGSSKPISPTKPITYTLGAAALEAVSIDGSGDAIVNASDNLNVTINGSGDVEYLGDPTTEIEISGSGDVH